MTTAVRFPMLALRPDYRSAGALLLLTALATAVSVMARLSANADATPLTDALAQSRNLEVEAIAALSVSEKLNAIGSAKVAYAAGGVARLVGGLTLLAAAWPLWRVMGGYHRWAMGAAVALLAASGVASAVSGGCAVVLAALAPEGQSAVGLGSAAGLDVGGEDALFTLRWFAGALGFALAGLGLAALGPVQWRVGGILRFSAVVGAALGLAMLFIWVDAATVVHRITGVGFLLWLIITGVWLLAGRTKAPENLPPRPGAMG